MKSNRSRAGLFGVVLSLLAITQLAPPPAAPSTRQSTPTTCLPSTAAKPTSSCASAPAAYPSSDLVKACDKSAADMQARLDGTFLSIVNAPFVVTGNLSADRLREYAKNTVRSSADAMWKCYFQKKPNEPIIILLFGDDASYRKWSKKLFNDENLSPYGYYRPWDKTMVMNIATGGGTLIHELTHALIVYDFPDKPDWFNEGLASLHECCSIGPDRLVGGVNWRLPGLKQAIDQRCQPTLQNLVTAEFYTADKGGRYAMSRYFFLYMQEKGVLRDFYVYFRDHCSDKDAAVAAIEKVFGKKIDQVDKEFIAWVATLKAR